MRRAIPYLAAAFLLAACGGGGGEEPWGEAGSGPAELPVASLATRSLAAELASSEAKSKPETPDDAAPTPECKPGTLQRLRTPERAYAALARRPLTVVEEPGGAGVVDRLGLENVNGYPTVLGVLGAVVDASCTPGWYLVQVPQRPNGARGYVRSGDVKLAPIETRIEIDLSRRELRFFWSGELVRTMPVAIGAPETPTPVGGYYVNQLLKASDPSGPWGPGGIGISAFSPVHINWPQGGPIAIHGTNDPSSIGQAVSNGCLRVSNENLLWLFERTPAGTPVTIRA